MTEEPRRSDRTTKGQHKNLDLIAEPPTKRSKAKKEKPAKPSTESAPEEAEEDEIIRCICGEYEEEEDVERDMICCDQCLAWQHNDCMGLAFAKGEEPDKYYCEKCNPDNHKDLLDRIARGEKPWEEAAERRRQEAEALKASRRRKGKKGKRGRLSVPKSEAKADVGKPSASVVGTPPAQTGSSAAPYREEKNGHIDASEPPSNQKRKFEEHQEPAQPDTGPKAKQQKVLSPTPGSAEKGGRKGSHGKEDPHASPPHQGLTVGTLEGISNPGRRNAAHALVRLFVDQLSEAQKRGSLELPSEKSTDDIAQNLGISIEHAMYHNICGGVGEPTEPYKLQLRTILFNVKKNSSLRDRLLVGSLLPDTLSKMSSQGMASEELQQKDAEIKRESERQHVIVEEEGPRIRRTHKGEEFVEDNHHNAASESVFSTAPARRSVAEIDGSPLGSASSSARQQVNREQAGHQRTDSKATEDGAQRQHDEPGVHSPDGTGQDAVFPEVAAHIWEPLPSGKAQADAEIDHLLRDDEPDSPPYSPKDYTDEETIWRGKVAMSAVAEFASSARHIGGADLSEKIPWSELVPLTLLVDGRIDIQLASNYLCGLRFSRSTDVSVIAISKPQAPAAQVAFDKLFNYFLERKRYGVISKHPLPAVTDTYVVPVEAGTAKRPEFIDLLENNSLEGSRPERLLLVTFVVKTGDSNRQSAQPPSHLPNQGPAAANSLVGTTAAPQSAQPGQPGQPGQLGQLMNTSVWSGTQGSQGSTTSLQGLYSHQSQSDSFPPPALYQQQTQPASVTGMAAATQLLGPQANSPAIQQLVQRAPAADISQLSAVRDILQQRPEVASNYDMLMQALALYQTGPNGHQQPDA